MIVLSEGNLGFISQVFLLYSATTFSAMEVNGFLFVQQHNILETVPFMLIASVARKKNNTVEDSWGTL